MSAVIKTVSIAMPSLFSFCFLPGSNKDQKALSTCSDARNHMHQAAVKRESWDRAKASDDPWRSCSLTLMRH